MDPRAFYKIGYGVYIVSSKKGDRLNGQIANTVVQVASEPPTIAVSLNKKNLTHEFVTSSKLLNVSVLSTETPLSFIGQFGFKSGRDINKFDNIKYKLGQNQAPIVIENVLAIMEAKVIQEIDVGTHTVFIALITNAEIFADGEPMSYSYYHEIKKGATPKTAPSYMEEKKAGVESVKSAMNDVEQKKEGMKMAKYECKVCGYVYDPAKGDPDNGVKPGTPFEILPDNWTCPVCGAAKDEFEKV